jgi:membrane protein required for colicin V production
MNVLDVVIGVLLIYTLIRGIFRGLVEEVSSIIGVIGGFYAAYFYYPVAARWLGRWISNPVYGQIVGFLVIFAAVIILVGVMGVVMKYLLNIAALGWLDRIGGALFGSLKGVLIVAVLLFALTAFLPKGAPLVEESHLAPHVTRASEILAHVVSKETRQQYLVKLDALKSSWNKRK